MVDKLLIIDISGLIARALKGAKVPDNAAPGSRAFKDPIDKFFQRFFSLLASESPNYLVIACDSPRATLSRTDWYPQYKEKRPPKTEVFQKQSALIYEILRELEMPMVKVAKWEADDVIASYVANYSHGITHVVVHSNDKDMHQLLVVPNMRITQPDGVIIRAPQAEARWNVPVNKIRQVQALAGDTTDGIPGAVGIGPAKAAPLIQKYGTAKAVKRCASELSEAQQKSLRDYDPDLNLRLVTLNPSIDIPSELEPWTSPTKKSVNTLLQNSGLSRAL